MSSPTQRPRTTKNLTMFLQSNVALAIILLGLTTLPATVSAKPSAGYTEWRGFYHGESGKCGDGEALVGVCTSGSNGNECQTGGNYFSHLIRCAKIEKDFVWHTDNNNDNGWIKANFKEYAKCGQDAFSTGRCASGVNEDCGAGHLLRCVNSPQHVILEPTETKDICKTYGEKAMCPPGYVVTQSCGAGGDGNNCRKDICSGASGPVFSGIRCTRIKGHKYAGLINNQQPSYKEPVISVANCKKQVVAIDTPKTDTVERTVQVTRSLERENTNSQTGTTSLSKKFGVSTKIEQSYGIPKVGSGKVTISANFESAYQTTLEKSSAYRETFVQTVVETKKVTEKVEFQPGSWLIASWGGRASGSVDFTVSFEEFSPGLDSKYVDEENTLTTSSKTADDYLLIIDMNCYDTTRLARDACEAIADNFMQRNEYFAPLAKNDEMTQYQSGSCPSRGGGGGGGGGNGKANSRRRMLTTGMPVYHGDETYTSYLDMCGKYDYDVSLHVDTDGHLLAIGNPKDPAAITAGCPSGATHAVLSKDAETAPFKEILFWEDHDEFNALFDKDGSLPMGTFNLAQIAGAFESAEPTNAAAAAAGQTMRVYDIVTNNCGSYMVNLANQLGISIDSHVTSFVARRLLERSGQQLVTSIRSSVNRFSLFQRQHGQRKKQHSHHNPQQQAAGLRRRGLRGDGREYALNMATDEELVEQLVNVGAFELL